MLIIEDQIKSLSDDDIKILSLQLEEKKKNRKNIKLKAAKDKLIEAIETYFDLGGIISMIGSVKCVSSQDIEKDLAVKTLTMHGF